MLDFFPHSSSATSQAVRSLGSSTRASTTTRTSAKTTPLRGTMLLCKACQKINFREILLLQAQESRRTNPLGSRDSSESPSGPPKYNHVVAWADYQDNCDLCRAFCRVLWGKDVPETGLSGNSSLQFHVEESPQLVDDEEYFVSRVVLEVVPEGYDWSGQKYILTFDAEG